MNYTRTGWMEGRRGRRWCCRNWGGLLSVKSAWRWMCCRHEATRLYWSCDDNCISTPVWFFAGCQQSHSAGFYLNTCNPAVTEPIAVAWNKKKKPDARRKKVGKSVFWVSLLQKKNGPLTRQPEVLKQFADELKGPLFSGFIFGLIQKLHHGIFFSPRRLYVSCCLCRFLSISTFASHNRLAFDWLNTPDPVIVWLELGKKTANMQQLSPGNQEWALKEKNISCNLCKRQNEYRITQSQTSIMLSFLI